MQDPLIEAARTAGSWLQARGWRLATAESCTGGLVAAAMTEIAGSSAWFDRGFVTYTNEAKQEMLGVSAATLARFGAVSEETVREMALGALAASKARVTIAISGIAGPSGGSPEKPVGTVCFGWAWQLEAPASAAPRVRVLRRHFEGDRAAIRVAAARYALEVCVKP